MVCRLIYLIVLHMFDAGGRVGTIAACLHGEEEDAIGELQSADMKKERRSGCSRGWQRHQAKAGKKNTRNSLKYHDAVEVLQSVHRRKTRKEGSTQGSKENRQEQ